MEAWRRGKEERAGGRWVGHWVLLVGITSSANCPWWHLTREDWLKPTEQADSRALFLTYVALITAVLPARLEDINLHTCNPGSHT